MQFPIEFEKRVKGDPFLGEELLNALNTNSPVSVRINPSKVGNKEFLKDLHFESEVPWCSDAYYLSERPSYTLDPLFHAGCYYPQEAGSMLVDLVMRSVDLDASPSILDLCAAPGGKSSLLASYLNGEGLLVCNEVIQARSKILRENMSKWGYTNTIVTNNDPKEFSRLRDFFDVILVDAPCSGEGMFRKDPESRDEWSPDNVQLCSARQKRILGDVWSALKPGGYIIYSTCTFNSSENEENVEFIANELGAEIIQMDLPLPVKSGRNGIGYYCLPGTTETEGFFISVLKKEEDDIRKTKFEIRKDFKSLSTKEIKDLQIEEFSKTEAYDFFQWNEMIIAFPSSVALKMQHVLSQMKIVKAGTIVGEKQRKGINPHEELALNPKLCVYKNRIDLSKEQALQYLHGDTFNLPGEHGWQLLTYSDQPLGWIKHLGNRFNNLYPKDWRIRMKI